VVHIADDPFSGPLHLSDCRHIQPHSLPPEKLNMKKNIGTLDQTLRIIAALATGLLILIGAISGLTALILGVVAAGLLLTSLFGICPLHSLLKLSTRKPALDK